MIGPVRPNAIATLITTDDFLPGVQTLLYSLHQKLPKPEQNADANYYPPELIVLTTPNISQQTKDALHPAFCTRLIEVDPIPIPKHTNHSSASASDSASAGEEKNGNGTGDGGNSKEDATDDLNASHVASWSDKCGYTKLHIFAQHVYDKILYLDSDCLVQKDVSHLLNIDIGIGMSSDTNASSSRRKGGLIAAAPDIFPPDKFNAGVMLLQPSLPLFHDLMTQSQSLTTYDGGDTGFLNAYFDDWHSYPAERRLGFQYNAQRFMHQCTYEKQPKYWDVAVGDIFVIHFSSSPKPWEESSVASASSKDGKGESASSQSDLLTKEEAAKIQQCESKSKALDKLWHKAYKKSMRFKEDYEEEQKLKIMQKVLPMKKKTLPVKKRSNAQSPATSQAAKKKQSSMSFQKRYKQLRKEEGMDSREAMKKARSEFGYDRDEKVSAGKQVAQMFGMPL